MSCAPITDTVFPFAASGLGPLIFGFARDQLGFYRTTLRVSVVVPFTMGAASLLMPWHGRPFSLREARLSAEEFLRGNRGTKGGGGSAGAGGSGHQRELVSLLGQTDGGGEDAREEE